MAINEKQRRFVEEFLIDLNGTQAAIRAGYSAKTADVQASRLLRNAKVQQVISERMAERSKRTGVNQDRVVLELTRVALVKMDCMQTMKGMLARLRACEKKQRTEMLTRTSGDLLAGLISS